jgi:hydroxymethylbilane synthase
MLTTLRLGTRASALALTQSELVAARLRASGWTVELVRVRTEGDRSTGSLAAMGGTGVFVTALREALLDGRCDIAVHSLKDLPTTPANGVALAAVPEREDPRDVLCARDGLTLATLPAGARVGTGSPRRAAQLHLARPDLRIVDIRGNVDTRLARVGPGQDDLDAVVLARAGLSRLGRLAEVTEVLGPDVMVSAPGQGALAVECRSSDLDRLGAGLRVLDHPPTRLAVTAERAVLAHLEAGCSAPVGAVARVGADGAADLVAVAVSPTGVAFRGRRTGRVATAADADRLGADLAAELLARGLPTAAPRAAVPVPTTPEAPDA